MRRLETSEFILQAKEVHGDKYTYENVNYFGGRIKVKINCRKHGIFTQLPKNHVHNKQGCPVCYGNKKLTTEKFILKAKEKHGNRYNYNETIYLGNHNKLNILCKKHGLFKQTATSHLNGDGCSKCNGGVKLNLNDFLLNSKRVHGDKYNYSNFKYINSKTKGIIICNIHGKFLQTPNNHTNQKQGCKKCLIEKRKLTTDKFILKAKEKHGNKYNYSKIRYENNNIKVLIICDIHGEFSQTPHGHLSGIGCKFYRQSKGEKKIRNFLIENNILFEQEKKFDECINKRKLAFDFYIKNQNMLIEFDGDQHKNSNNFFGGLKGFEYRKGCDDIKNKFARNNNIKLLRINYNDYRSNRVENILENNLIMNNTI